MTKTVESEGDGTKEVTTTTEKATEVEEIDGGQAEKTTEVKKTTEVHKAGGATMTVTKTSTRTQVRQTGGGRGWWIFFFFKLGSFVGPVRNIVTKGKILCSPHVGKLCIAY